MFTIFKLFDVCLQSSQWGVSRLRYRLTEDVSRRKNRVHPLADQSGIKVYHGFRWSKNIGEKQFFFGSSLSFWCDSIDLNRYIFSTERSKAGAAQRSCQCLRWADYTGKRIYMVLFFQLDILASVLKDDDLFCLMLLRLLRGMALTATCWGSSCRPLRKDSAFPKSSWTPPMAWRRTGSCGQDRSVHFMLYD